LIQYTKTSKLAYGKYLYKVTVNNPIGHIFRTELQRHGNLSFVRTELDTLREQRANGEPMFRRKFRYDEEVPEKVYQDARKIYLILKSQADYTVRVTPNGNISVYSNNEKLIDTITRIASDPREVMKPDDEEVGHLTSDQNIILVDNEPVFPIKITLNSNKSGSGIASWLRANTDKSKVGYRALEALENNWYANGFYFYVRDEKVLNMIYMLVGNSIRRVDKLVYRGNIDK